MVGNIKHIQVIQSLPIDENSGEVLYNEVIARRIELMQNDGNKMSHGFSKVASENELIEVFKYLEANAKYINGGILVHLEIHGSENMDGLVLKNGTLIKWKQLVEMIRPININTCNRLFLTMATCYGRYLYSGIDSKEKSPYSGFISASKEISYGEVMEKFNLLFEELTANYNIVQSYLVLEKSDSSFFYKDSEKCFEEAINVTKKEFIENPEFRVQIKNDLIQFGFDPEVFSKADHEEMTKKVLGDIYKKHKSTFMFNCD